MPCGTLPSSRLRPCFVAIVAGRARTAQNIFAVSAAARIANRPLSTAIGSDASASKSPRPNFKAESSPLFPTGRDPPQIALGRVGTASGPLTASRVDHAYFTGNPKFYNLTIRLNELIRKHNLPFRPLSPVDQKKQATGRWMKQEEMQQEKQMKLSEKAYRSLIRKFNVLTRVREKDPEVRQLLLRFEAPQATGGRSATASSALDEYGRSLTRGSRKTARAHCWMVEGDGQIYVNGIPMSEYFKQFEDKERIVKPLEATGKLGKYNVWAIVAGGGPSGQAGAVAVAIARGIAAHDRSQWSALGPLTKIDTRQVERKKTGQPGARKKNTWVKR
ncbi:ribosomal protein S9/S16-domain-containing protein [Zopfochytrium polystomum]|nr:ribosomal protein S9/S16-domain-containing protein [Zopfochytrium polystomum]